MDYYVKPLLHRHHSVGQVLSPNQSSITWRHDAHFPAMPAAQRSKIAKSARLPNRVAEYRGRAGLSQEQLAELVGVTQTQIGKIERGDLVLSLPQAVKLAQILGCKSYELLNLPDSPGRRAQQMIELFDRLTGDKQETLLTLGRALAAEPARFDEGPDGHAIRRDRRA